MEGESEKEENRPEDTGACSDEPNSAESSHCWSAVGPPSHPSSHPLPAHTHMQTQHYCSDVQISPPALSFISTRT